MLKRIGNELRTLLLILVSESFNQDAEVPMNEERLVHHVSAEGYWEEHHQFVDHPHPEKPISGNEHKPHSC